MSCRDSTYSSTGRSWNTMVLPSASESSAAICSWSISTGPEIGMVVPMWPSAFCRSLGDDAALVVRGDRRMPALPDGHPQDALLHVRQLPRVEQPLQEVGRPQVHDVHAGPVEDLFGDERVAARIARRPPVRGPLRQVDHRPYARLLRRLGKVHRGMDEAGRYRPDEIGGIDAFHRRANGVDVEQVALDDLGAELRPARAHGRPRCERVHER